MGFLNVGAVSDRERYPDRSIRGQRPLPQGKPRAFDLKERSPTAKDEPELPFAVGDRSYRFCV
jgi:hypothetical protein